MKEIYHDRRNIDVESTHQFSRNAAQSMILINGGAATALLASNSQLVSALLKNSKCWLAASLACFATGLALATFMHWCEREALFRFSRDWQLKTDEDNPELIQTEVQKQRELGDKWHRFSKWSFFSSGLFFIFGCTSIAIAIFLL